MSEADDLRRRLTKLLKKTAAVEGMPVAAYFEDFPASKAAFADDERSGRVAFRQSRRDAELGIEALDEGEFERARRCAWFAAENYIEALERAIRSEDRLKLEKPAKGRGKKVGDAPSLRNRIHK